MTTQIEGGTSVAKGIALTCISCRMMFVNSKEQREHYKSELHRFNLKRKVANLPPVSQEVFQERFEANTQQPATSSPTTTSKQVEEDSKQQFMCTACNKQYSSENTFNQHNKSKKHIEKVKEGETNGESTKKREKKQVIATPMETEPTVESKEVESADAEMAPTEGEEADLIDQRIKNAKPLALEECLFCSVKSKDLESSLSHMAHEHGFFIPDIEYMKDLEGFIRYLGEKVAIGNVCLFCNGKGRGFWSTEGVQAHMRGLNHCKILYDDNEEEYEDYYDFNRDYGENSNPDEPLNVKSTARVSDNGSELIFEDGKSVGHRAYNVYYRQKMRPAEARESVIINALVSQYRLLGWTGTFDKEQANRRQDPVHEKTRALANMQLGQKSNKLQRHFRAQIL